jgi:hypothetical protein
VTASTAAPTDVSPSDRTDGDNKKKSARGRPQKKTKAISKVQQGKKTISTRIARGGESSRRSVRQAKLSKLDLNEVNLRSTKNKNLPAKPSSKGKKIVLKKKVVPPKKALKKT